MSRQSEDWFRIFEEDSIAKSVENSDIDHKEWQLVVAYYVNTLNYDPTSIKFYDKGLEIMHTEMIPMCANLATENYFNEVAVEDNCLYMADECELGKVEPGYYKCVCGVTIDSVQSQTQDGVEWDTETYYYMISRTKLTPAEVDYIIEEHKIYPTDEEYAEIVAAHIA